MRSVPIAEAFKIIAIVSVPAGCTLDFKPGGRLIIPSGGTLQVYGGIKADRGQQVFAADPATSVIHGFGTQQVSVRWFGAKGDGATNDNDAFELTSKFGSTAQSIAVFVPRGTYVIGKEDAIKPVYDKIAALFSPSQTATLQGVMDALIDSGALFSQPSAKQLKDQWQSTDRSLPYLSCLGVFYLYTVKPNGLDSADAQAVSDFKTRLKQGMSASELAQIATPKRAYAPRDTLVFTKVPNVRIEGEKDAMGQLQSKLVLDPGLKFGAFDPNTGKPHRSYNEKGKEIATSVSFYAAFSGPMVSVTGADSVDIDSLDLDGNGNLLELGGFYGDTGYQLPNHGISLQQNKRASIRNVFTHRQGADGISIRWSGLDETAPDYPHVLDRIRADDNGRNGITISDANDFILTNSDVDSTATGKISSLPRAGIDIESENVIRNARFENDNFIGNKGSQISATWNVSYLTFDHVHAKGQQALWMRAPGVTIRHSLIEGLVSGLPYGDGQTVSHHAWQGQQVICPSIALVSDQRITLDTATEAIDGSDPAKPVVYCPGYKAAGVSLATRITDTQFIADSDVTMGAWNGGASATGENVFFSNDLFKVIVRTGSGMRLPDLVVKSGKIRDSKFEIQKDAMTAPNLIGLLGGFSLENVTVTRIFGPGVAPIDNAYIRCLESAPNTYSHVTTSHIRWCSPTGPVHTPDKSGIVGERDNTDGGHTGR